jgi:AcrR family transcriptional regulator
VDDLVTADSAGDPTADSSARRRGGRLPRQERRVQLLESALEVFVAQGYHAAAMDDIAVRAGVSKPVLYQHFPGKLDLYLALLDASCDAIVDNCRDALESTHDNKQRVAATMDVFFEYVAGDTGAFRLVFESDLTNEPAVRERVDRVTTDCAAMIASVIHEDTGLPDAEARLLAVCLVGMAQVSARFWLSEASGSTSRIKQGDAAALVAGLAWRGIRGYPLADEH